MQCQKRQFDDDSSHSYKESDSSSDGVLRTEDGSKFNINRNLLARQCPFFSALFCDDYVDGTDVLLKGIDSKTLRSILVYLYTGSILLNKKNAADILVASDYLLIDSLAQESRSFVLREIIHSSCVPLFLATWRIEMLYILNNCQRFIVIHFEKVSQSEEISNLPLEALKKMLKEKCLNVSGERTVGNVIVRWIKFDLPDRLQFVQELSRYISFDDVDETLANDIIFHNLIQENNFCQDLVFRELPHTDFLQNFQQILNSQSNMSGSRIPTKVHLIVHKSIEYDGLGEKIYLTWDGEIDYWRRFGSVFFFPEYLIQLDHYVYIFATSIKESLVFDLFDEKWFPMTPIYKTRRFYSVVTVNGFIYVIGGTTCYTYILIGVNPINPMEDIERFDPRTGKWELVSHMVPMSLSKAVAVNGYIYATGYTRGVTNTILMVQVYDPASDRWSSVSAPRHFNSVIITIAYGEHLYLIGGEGSGQTRMIKYDPLKDVWIPMPDLPVAYSFPRATVLKDVLIVYDEVLVYRTSGENTPPVYWNSETRKWHIIQESSPLRMTHNFRFCTITEPNVVKGIVKINRQKSTKFVKSPLV